MAGLTDALSSRAALGHRWRLCAVTLRRRDLEHRASIHWRIGTSEHCLGASSRLLSKAPIPLAFGPPGEEAMGEFKRTAGQRAVRRPHLYAVAELAHRSVQQQHCR